MGCGVSSLSTSSSSTLSTIQSNTQIVPINNQINFKNNNEIITKQQQNRCRIINGLNFSLCKFIISNNPSQLDANNTIYYKNVNHCEIQTDPDDNGFKCQYTQTDSINMDDDEFDAMIEALDKQIINEISNKNIDNVDNNENNNDDYDDDDDDDDDDELIKKHKKTFELLPENCRKKFINVAIQATKKKFVRSTQTKFGSIDYCFLKLSNNEQELLKISKNLTKAIVDCKSNNNINNDNDGDQSIKELLLSFDDNDDFDNENEQNCYNEDVDDGYESNIIKDKDNNNNDEKNLTKTITTTTKINRKKSPIDTLWYLQSKKLIKQQKVQDCIFLLLNDIRKKKSLEQLLPNSVTNGNIIHKKDVSLQTINDILTDESPEFAARSPLCYKNELIPSILMFNEIDEKVLQISDINSTKELANYIGKLAKNDLFKIRALFIWITKNICLNTEINHNNNNDNILTEILKQKQCNTSKDYCYLFENVCRTIGIRVKIIEGFVRNYHYRPGYHFQPGKDTISTWNAAFLLGSWRFIDLTLASGYIDKTGEFYSKTNEHYFLTDPSVMIWTHFPYNELEENYDRWQLLDKPFTLNEFNQQPKITENFFKYNLRLRSKIQNPLEFRISTEIKIGSNEAMRYKYKLYSSNETENSSLNYYVFCQLKEDRLVGSFMVQPPLAGRFILKIFAKPEREMQGSQQDLTATLDPIITILLDCTKARKYIEPFPLNELPWGLTQKFYDYKLRFSNQKGPIIVTWGGRRRLILESNETMLITYSLYDSDSMEMDTRNIIIRDDNGFKTIFTINPPRVGTFKFMLFGMPKPKQKGKWRLPMLATFMIDCKLIKPLQHDEDQLNTTHTINDNENADKKNKSKK